MVIVITAGQGCGKGFNALTESRQNSDGSSISTTRLPIFNLKTSQYSAGQVSFELNLSLPENGSVVSDQSLKILDEKKLHLFIYDKGLKEYRHLHPEFIDGKWIANTQLSVNGNYLAWVLGQLSGEAKEFLVSQNFFVVGGQAQNPSPPQLTEMREASDQVAGLRLSQNTIIARSESMVTVEFFRVDGKSPLISNYLGKKAHVTAISNDGAELIHVHPKEAAGVLMLHMEFSTVGNYRLFAQFIEDGILHTVALSVKAESGNIPPPPMPPPRPVPVNVSFKADIVPIFNSKCVSCHSAGVYDPRPAFDCRGWLALVDQPLGSIIPTSGQSTGCNNLDLHTRLMGAPWQCNSTDRHIVPGSPSTSYLYNKILGISLCAKDSSTVISEVMPPPTAPQLTANEKDTIKKWIEDGAPNN